MTEIERRFAARFKLRTPLSFHRMEDLPEGARQTDGLCPRQESFGRRHVEVLKGNQETKTKEMRLYENFGSDTNFDDYSGDIARTNDLASVRESDCLSRQNGDIYSDGHGWTLSSARTIAGTFSWGVMASTFTYTTPPATMAMNGEKIYLDLFVHGRKDGIIFYRLSDSNIRYFSKRHRDVEIRRWNGRLRRSCKCPANERHELGFGWGDHLGRERQFQRVSDREPGSCRHERQHRTEDWDHESSYVCQSDVFFGAISAGINRTHDHLGIVEKSPHGHEIRSVNFRPMSV